MNSKNTESVPKFLHWGRTVAIVTVNLLIALDHFFRLGTLLREPLSRFYYSYFYDVVIPFGMYLLLCLDNVDIRFRYLRDWRVKAVLVFGVGSFTEVLQGFGVPILGRTFDPLDFVMFAVGVLLAVLADRFVLDRFFPRRSPKTTTPADNDVIQ